ncbi:MAG: hypothetical protein Kow00117_09640 [Phototrophicales bacterium]
MRPDDLLNGLRTNNPETRLRAAWTIGMLEETLLLDQLALFYVDETDRQVKRAISEAEQRLRLAISRHYTTLDGLCQHFKIDREIEAMMTAKEADIIRMMEVNLNKGNKPNNGLGSVAAAAAIGGMMMGTSGVLAGASTAMSARNIHVNDRPLYNALANRDMPVPPTNRDISLQLKILKISPDPKARQQAIFDIIGSQNPAALPYLAEAFYNDTDMQVRETAEKVGKRIYWNALYYTMEQDGSIIEVMRQRALAAGKLIPQQEDQIADESSLAFMDDTPAVITPPKQPLPPRDPKKPLPKIKLSKLLEKEQRKQPKS